MRKVCVKTFLALLLGVLCGFAGEASAQEEEGTGLRTDLSVQVMSPILDAYPQPDGGPQRAGKAPLDILSISAAAGEYESAWLGLRCGKPISNISVELTDLKGPGGIVPAAAFDVRWVLWWYPLEPSPRASLVAELLAHDPNLIINDYKTHTSRGRSAWHKIRDAARLVPTDIKSNWRQDVWVTVHVPEDTSPGTYQGQVLIKSGKKIIRRIDAKLKIHAFKLLAPKLSYMLYYPIKTAGSRMPQYNRTAAQIETHVRDMIAHGCDNVIWYCPPRIALMIRKKLGMTGPYFGTSGPPLAETPKAAEELRKALYAFKAAGIDEVYVYGIDEPSPAQYTNFRKYSATTHKIGAKVFTALMLKYQDPKAESDMFMDILDVVIMYGARIPRGVNLVDDWHAAGKKVYNYADPFSHLELAETNRRNYGLRAWRRGFDGVANWAYQFGQFQPDDPFSNQRQDFMYTYPTARGPLPTLRWEAFREGVDDVRYLTTLLASIEQARADSSKSRAVRRAKRWLDEFDDVHGNLDVIRATMVRHIEALLAP